MAGIADLLAPSTLTAAAGTTIAAALIALAFRRRPLPSARSWWIRAFVWLALAATLGAVVFAVILNLIGAVVQAPRFVSDPSSWGANVIGSLMYMAFVYPIIAMAIFALPYLPVLLLWARLGPVLGRLETSRSGVLVSALILAIPATVFAVIAYGRKDVPYRLQGMDLFVFAITIQTGIAVGLATPRLLIPWLAPGVFSAPTRAIAHGNQL